MQEKTVQPQDAQNARKEGEKSAQTAEGEKSLETLLAEAQAKIEQQREAMLRAVADADNARKRAQAEAATAQKYALERFADGLPANNALLWGARGMGKSSLVKATHANINIDRKPADRLKLIEIHREDIESLPGLMDLLRSSDFRFIVFCDDLSFDGNDASYKSLKAVLEGGIEGRPDNVILYATSNRRHLVQERWTDRESTLSAEIHGRRGSEPVGYAPLDQGDGRPTLREQPCR